MSLRDLTRWSSDTRVGLPEVISAAAGLGGPVAYGVVSGHLAEGMPATIGALAASGVVKTGGAGRHAAHLSYAVLTATAAGFVGASIAGRGWTTAAAVVVVACVVSVLGGFSRTSAEMSTRFATFVVITTGLGSVSDPGDVAQKFALGAAWAALVALLAGACTPHPESSPTPALNVRLRYWWKSLRVLRGWQYTLRLGLCLAAAEAIGTWWHQPKAYWIAVTVVIVVQRRLEGALLRAVERSAGTAVGVLVGSVTLLWVPSSWALVAVVALLAAARPLLKARNYTLYATVMTPLVVLLLDFGQSTSPSTIVYRLVDTAVGSAIALGIGYLPWLRLHRAG